MPMTEEEAADLALWEVETDVMLGRYKTPADVFEAMKSLVEEAECRSYCRGEDFYRMEKSYLDNESAKDKAEQKLSELGEAVRKFLKSIGSAAELEIAVETLAPVVRPPRSI